MKRGNSIVEDFNFDAVYSADEGVNSLKGENSVLKLEGIKPTDVKPSTASSRESMFIFNKAVSAFSSLTRPTMTDTSSTLFNTTTRMSSVIIPPFSIKTESPTYHSGKARREDFTINLSNTNVSSMKAIVSSLEDSSEKNPFKTKPLSNLNNEEIREWLESINMGKYSDSFIENNLTGSVLAEIDSVTDLIDCGVSMPPPVARAFLTELATVKTKGVTLS